MSRKAIAENVKRRLWAESMGRCMNPDCKTELFSNSSDIAEQAHIHAYSKTEDNSFDNLIILCPNCHTSFDKADCFDIHTVREWKRIRQEELGFYFSKTFTSFQDLQEVVAPLLRENQEIYKRYFLTGNRELWEQFEEQILVNNEKLKKILEANLGLMQSHKESNYSNKSIVQQFILHINEFSITRQNKERVREVIFPSEINSIFGIEPIDGNILPSTESLEILIEHLKNKGEFERLELGVRLPHIVLKEECIYLNDTPRLRQMYHVSNAFRPSSVRLDSLNYAMYIIKSKKINFTYIDETNIREILIKNTRIIFVYEYCLSAAFLKERLPEANSVIVNLHNWNGNLCISSDAYKIANNLNISLLTLEEFNEFITKFK